MRLKLVLKNSDYVALTKEGKVINSDGTLYGFVNGQFGIVKQESKTPIYTKVYAPNPQGLGITTLSKVEYEQLKLAVARGELYTIYRGEVKDEDGNLITKDINNEEYTSKAIAINLTIENGEIVIKSQSNKASYKMLMAIDYEIEK